MLLLLFFTLKMSLVSLGLCFLSYKTVIVEAAALPPGEGGCRVRMHRRARYQALAISGNCCSGYFIVLFLLKLNFKYY